MTHITELQFNDHEASEIHSKIVEVLHTVEGYIRKYRMDDAKTPEWCEKQNVTKILMSRDSLIDALGHFEDGAGTIVREYDE